MKTTFWYQDNWNGTIREFETLRQAKESAANQTDSTVYIHSSTGKTYMVKASGVIYN